MPSPLQSGPPLGGPYGFLQPQKGGGGATLLPPAQTAVLEEQFGNICVTQLAIGIGPNEVSLTITDAGTGPFAFPTVGQFRAVFGSRDTNNYEIIIVGAVDGLHWTNLTRGAENTQAIAHNAGDTIRLLGTAGAMYQLRADATATARLGDGIQVAAGSTVFLSRNVINCLIVDITGLTAVNITFPSNPVHGDLVILSTTGLIITNPPQLNSNGALIADPNNPGTTSSNPTLITIPGNSYAWQYESVNNTWQLLWGLTTTLISVKFTTVGTTNFIAPLTGTYQLDGAGGCGAGGAGANGLTNSATSQNGGGGGGASIPPPTGRVFITAGVVVPVTIPAVAIGVAGAAGQDGGDAVISNLFTAPGAKGGEWGGTPVAGTNAAGGTPNRIRGIGRLGTNNPSWTEDGLGGWGGAIAPGLPDQAGVQGKGAVGFPNLGSNTGLLGTGGSGGVQGATNGGQAGGCGGGGGGAAIGVPGSVATHNGGNGRQGGAGSAAGVGANGTNGISASTAGGGGGGGGAGGNGLTGGGTGGTGGSGGQAWGLISFVGFTGL